MADSNVTLIAETGTSKHRKNDGRLPCLVGEPTPTAELVEEFLHKQTELAKKEFNFLHAVSLITPEDDEAFRAAPIDVVLPKKDRQEDKALKELERERRHEANRACIRKFLEIGRELKKSDPESKLFKMSEELLDYLDRIESDLHSVSKYEWKKLDSGLRTYVSLLRGEAQQRCQATSPDKTAQTKQDIPSAREDKPDVNIHISGGIQAENVQIGNHASIHKQPKAEERPKFSILGWMRKKIYHLLGVIIASLFVAILIDIFGDLGWLQQIKAFIYSIFQLE